MPKSIYVSRDQNEIRDSKDPIAVFMEYGGENRCGRCCFADSKACAEVPCSEDERRDKKRGFFRAANIKGTNYSVADGFKF